MLELVKLVKALEEFTLAGSPYESAMLLHNCGEAIHFDVSSKSILNVIELAMQHLERCN